MACLFLLNSLNVGGSEKKSVRLANALSDRGHDIHIAFLNHPDDLRESIAHNIPVYSLDRSGKFDPRIPLKLTRYLQRNAIDNLFCMNLYPYLYGYASAVMARTNHVKCMAFINITDFLLTKEKLQMALYKPLLRRAANIVFGCRAQQDQWTASYYLPRERSTVIYNGVDCSFFAPRAMEDSPETLREKYGLATTDFVITTVAELRPEKGHVDLISACDVLARAGHPVRLILVGDGPEKVRIASRIAACGLTDRVHFWGRLDDVREALSVADIFALPSVAVETFSNAALEAMAMGIPVVLSDIGGAAEMVVPGENGFLFPPSDVRALVAIVAGLIDRPDTRRAMGAKARTIARDRFDFEHMVDRYEQLMPSPAPSRSDPAGKRVGLPG